MPRVRARSTRQADCRQAPCGAAAGAAPRAKAAGPDLAAEAREDEFSALFAAYAPGGNGTAQALGGALGAYAAYNGSGGGSSSSTTK